MVLQRRRSRGMVHAGLSVGVRHAHHGLESVGISEEQTEHVASSRPTTSRVSTTHATARAKIPHPNSPQPSRTQHRLHGDDERCRVLRLHRTVRPLGAQPLTTPAPTLSTNGRIHTRQKTGPRQRRRARRHPPCSRARKRTYSGSSTRGSAASVVAPGSSCACGETGSWKRVARPVISSRRQT